MEEYQAYLASDDEEGDDDGSGSGEDEYEFAGPEAAQTRRGEEGKGGLGELLKEVRAGLGGTTSGLHDDEDDAGKEMEITFVPTKQGQGARRTQRRRRRRVELVLTRRMMMMAMVGLGRVCLSWRRRSGGRRGGRGGRRSSGSHRKG